MAIPMMGFPEERLLTSDIYFCRPAPNIGVTVWECWMDTFAVRFRMGPHRHPYLNPVIETIRYVESLLFVQAFIHDFVARHLTQEVTQ